MPKPIGSKDDIGKTEFDLLEPRFIEAMAQVMTKGAAKYKPYNWQYVPQFHQRYLAALYRHLIAYHKGEVIDRESGLPHMAHIACNAMFLFWSDLRDGNPDI